MATTSIDTAQAHVNAPILPKAKESPRGNPQYRNGKQRVNEASAGVYEKLEANERGAQKKGNSRFMDSKYNTLPPVRFLSQEQLTHVGLAAGKTRYNTMHYLEERELRRKGLQWPPREDVPVPRLSRLFRPLTEKAPKDGIDPWIREKQREIDQLLDDEGLLLNSDRRKRVASELELKQTKRSRKQ